MAAPALPGQLSVEVSQLGVIDQVFVFAIRRTEQLVAEDSEYEDDNEEDDTEIDERTKRSEYDSE